MVSEIITLEGHIIDSGMLPRVLDDILDFGADFHIQEIRVGRQRDEPSHARLEVRTKTREQMHELLNILGRQGAIWHAGEDAELIAADMDGAFPDGFYCSTNQRTYVRHDGRWYEVQRQEMDCGIVFDPQADRFACVPMVAVRRGDLVVCGERGIRVAPLERPRTPGVFEFMASDVSSEKPKNTIVRQCAQRMRSVRQQGGKILLVGGPAIVHTGAVEHIVRLIETGYVNVLFAGNALAAHDVEYALFGTSLGVHIDQATLVDGGHMHHLRAVNTIRRLGGLRQAVQAGMLRSGIMHACITHDVPYVLAGSIRDDGPLPDVITDVVEAQQRMREALDGVGLALMVATALHSIATGNLLPAWVPAVCVDISPPVSTKLADRGSFQTVSVVTDVEPFLRVLLSELEPSEG